MGLRHMRVVYKSPDCYEMVVVAGKQIGAPMRVSLGTQPGSSHSGGGAAVLLWPRSATITKRVQLPPTAGDRLLSAMRFELDGQLPFPIADAAIAAYCSDPPASDSPDKTGEPRPVLAFAVRTAEIQAAVAELAEHGIKVSHVVPATVALAYSLPSTEGAHVHLELRPNDNEAIFLMNNRLVASVWIGEDDESAQAAQLRLWWQGLQRAGLATQATLSLRGIAGSHSDLAQKLAPYFQTVSAVPPLRTGDTGHVSNMALGSQLSLWSDLDTLEITPEVIKQQRGNLRRRQRVVTVAAIIGLSVGFAVGLGNVAVAGLEDREARLNAEWRALSQDVKSEDTLRKERDALLKESEAWASILEQRLDWPALFSYMNNAVPTGVRISEVRLEKGKSYQILGIADNTSLATQFVDQLRSSQSWGNARLDLTKTVEDGNTGQVSFVVGGTLIAKSTAPAK